MIHDMQWPLCQLARWPFYTIGYDMAVGFDQSATFIYFERKEPLMPEALNALPQYKSHKIVRAAKITEIKDDGTLVFGELVDIAGPGPVEFRPPPGWMNRHNPVVGAYLVAHDAGELAEYVTCWSSSALEGEYTKVDEYTKVG